MKTSENVKPPSWWEVFKIRFWMMWAATQAKHIVMVVVEDDSRNPMVDYSFIGANDDLLDAMQGAMDDLCDELLAKAAARRLIEDHGG